MLNLPNATVTRRFCGLTRRDENDPTLLIACSGEAVGSLSFEDDDGLVEFEICEYHRKLVSERVDNGYSV